MPKLELFFKSSEIPKIKDIHHICEASVRKDLFGEITLKLDELWYIAQLFSDSNNPPIISKNIKNLIFQTRNSIFCNKNLKDLKDMISINSTIEELDLSNNHLNKSCESMRLLGEALAINKGLKKLNLSNNNLFENEAYDFEFLKDGLIKNKTIENLDLTGNYCPKKPEEVKKYESYLKDILTQIPNLRELKYSILFVGFIKNYFDKKYFEDLPNGLMNVLIEGLAENVGLECLDISKAKILLDSDGLKLFDNAVNINKSLRKIKINPLHIYNIKIHNRSSRFISLLDTNC